MSVQRELEVYGKDAYELIQLMTCRNLSKALPNKCYYVPLVDKDGYIINDPLIIKINDQKWRICIADSDVILFAKGILSTKNLSAEIYETNISTLAIQGPKSREILAKTSVDLATIQRFHVKQIEYKSSILTAAGTGYTGEDGLEISVPLAVAGALWEELIGYGAKPAGLGARDTLRLEAGLPLHGNELSPTITSAQANMKWVVATTKDNFLGKPAVMEEIKNGVSRKLFGLQTEGRRPPRTGQLIVKDGKLLGEVTSGNYSPTLECGIAIALLDPKVSLGEKVTIQGRRNEEEATIVKLPFYTAQENS